MAVLDHMLALTERADHWVATELRDMRRAAQREADAAYDTWRRRPGDAAYVTYRAAQDRADAAQDHLAQWLSPTSAA